MQSLTKSGLCAIFLCLAILPRPRKLGVKMRERMIFFCAIFVLMAALVYVFGSKKDSPEVQETTGEPRSEYSVVFCEVGEFTSARLEITGNYFHDFVDLKEGKSFPLGMVCGKWHPIKEWEGHFQVNLIPSRKYSQVLVCLKGFPNKNNVGSTCYKVIDREGDFGIVRTIELNIGEEKNPDLWPVQSFDMAPPPSN